MHAIELRKPDGRALTLYGRAPVTDVGPLYAPPAGQPGDPHLRWQPLRGEWVAYAPHRQDRTFLPAAADNPLRPSADPARPTELPTGSYDIAVFDNLFPSLRQDAGPPPALPVPTRPASGHCEVVVFTRDPAASLASLPVDHIDLLLEVWGDRTRRIGGRPGIRYVLPFENRGAEVGVTLHHPHGQLYAYPFVPPVPAAARRREVAHFSAHGATLLQNLIDREVRDGRRMLYAGRHAVAFVPVAARYPYEVWLAPRRPAPWLHDLTGEERRDLARALATVVRKYDGLWARPFPYVMAWYQATTGTTAGDPTPGAHLHAEFLPPCRRRDRLKYLAGTELAAGTFVCDALPEDTARELQKVPVSLDDVPPGPAAQSAADGTSTRPA